VRPFPGEEEPHAEAPRRRGRREIATKNTKKHEKEEE
jgi:hypothetical protein